LIEAGIPEGVVNIVNGAHAAVNGILEHPGIEAVSFVGSQPVAEHVYTHGSAHGKRVQALAGAKNSMVVMPDAVLEKAVPNIISSAYGNAGERCLAGSVLVAVGEAGDRVAEAVREAAENMKVGPGYEEDSEFTSLIRDSHRDRVRSYVDLGEEEGATVALDGREPPLDEGFFFGPTISDGVTGDMRIAREEIFGPVLSVVRVNSLEEAVEFTNGSPFGNACSIYTENGSAVRYCARTSRRACWASTSGWRRRWRSSRSTASRTPSTATCTPPARTASASSPRTRSRSYATSRTWLRVPLSGCQSSRVRDEMVA
jgi:malonate-semialdehyde dehydrogenase (acetylating) / methylmalonate-semialdehyde dehydrogenase